MATIRHAVLNAIRQEIIVYYKKHWHKHTALYSEPCRIHHRRWSRSTSVQSTIRKPDLYSIPSTRFEGCLLVMTSQQN